MNKGNDEKNGAALPIDLGKSIQLFQTLYQFNDYKVLFHHHQEKIFEKSNCLDNFFHNELPAFDKDFSAKLVPSKDKIVIRFELTVNRFTLILFLINVSGNNLLIKSNGKEREIMLQLFAEFITLWSTSESKRLNFEITKGRVFLSQMNEITSLINRKSNFLPDLEEILSLAASFVNARFGIIFIKVRKKLFLASFGLSEPEHYSTLNQLKKKSSWDINKLKLLFPQHLSVLFNPITYKNKYFGGIFFVDKETRLGRDIFDEWDNKLLLSLTNQINFAVTKLVDSIKKRRIITLTNSVINAVTSGIVALDNNHKTILMNNKAKDIFHPLGTIKAKYFTESLPKLSPLKKFIETNLEGKSKVIAENIPFSASQPKLFTVYFSPLVLKNSNKQKKVGSVFAFDDVTELQTIKESFSKYVSGEVLQKILFKKSKNRLGGELINCAVLFSDIRGFTSFSEKLAPEEVVEMLNQYYNLMLGWVTEFTGNIDKLVGDEIMAVFKESEEQLHPAIRAVNSAMKMLESLELFNSFREEQGLEPIFFGVGIHYGSVISGNIGSFQRMDYTIIGDNVNIAARLCSIAGKNQILVTEAVVNKIANESFKASLVNELVLKGKVEKIKVFKVDKE